MQTKRAWGLSKNEHQWVNKIGLAARFNKTCIKLY